MVQKVCVNVLNDVCDMLDTYGGRDKVNLAHFHCRELDKKNLSDELVTSRLRAYTFTLLELWELLLLTADAAITIYLSSKTCFLFERYSKRCAIRQNWQPVSM